MIEIDKNIPMPERRVGSSALPFDLAKEVGDSFSAGLYSREAMQRIGAYISAYESKHPDREFAARKTEDNHIRVWRIK